MRKSSIILVAMAILLAGASACAQKKDYPAPPPYVGQPQGKFPISASYAFYDPFMTDQQFEWVKEAGFTSIQKSLGYTDNERLIEMASLHEMPLFIGVGEDIRDTTRTRGIVARFKDRPGVWGFSVFDEPNESQFEMLGKVRDKIIEETSRQNVYINLLPAVGSKQLGAKDYAEYVEEYVRSVNPPFLSFDIYPVKTRPNGEIFVDPVLYTSIETIARVARESGRPFWSYVLANKHWMYPMPKEEFIRFQAFTALAYGAQGLQYFTYLLPDYDKDKGEYTDAPIDREGKRTKTWYMVKNVNSEIHNLSHVFLGAEVIEVTQTGTETPEGTKRNYTVPSPFRSIESFGEGVTVSHLRNGDSEYLLLINRDVLSKQKVRLSRLRSVTRLYGDGTERPESGETITLQPGGYALYRL